LKNTIALGWSDRAVISPHVGDFGSPRTLAVFEHTVAGLQSLYGVRACAVAHDAHPGYATTRWARDSGLARIAVPHHRAHASALHAEHGGTGDWLVFAWDGVGLGEDGTLWGGEALLGQPGRWRRVATMRPFRPPGGETAAHEPWRSAAGLCWEAGVPFDADALAFEAWRKHVNCPQTSAVGRLFDAAAAMTGLIAHASYEAQAPMLLEAAAGEHPAHGHAIDEAPALPLVRNRAGLWETDWAPLIPLLLDPRRGVPGRAALFHTALAQALLQQVCAVHKEHAVTAIGLTGGVFQNRLLCEQACALLAREGFDAKIARRVPCNDAGLAFGQLVEAAAA
jgi:hydrogenase maturation protein HypF